MKNKIVIAVGSTGGHFFPGLAVARYLREKYKVESMFWGPIKLNFQNILQEEKFSFVNLSIPSTSGNIITVVFSYYPSMFKAVIQSFFFLCHARPKLVMGTGSFGSFPACISAYLLRIPLLLHEQNIVSGKANKFLAKFAQKIFLAFPNSSLISKKSLVVGNPVEKFKPNPDKQTCYKNFGLDKNKKTLLVFGGSQGAVSLNTWTVDVLEKLSDFENWQVIHITGEADYWRVREKYIKLGTSSVVLPFLFPMDCAYLISDLAITRGGALSLSELSFWGVPSLIVPYVYAKDNHQKYNALYFQEKSGAYLLKKTDIEKSRVPKILQELINSPDKLKKTSENIKKVMPNDALEKICEEIYKYIKSND